MFRPLISKLPTQTYTQTIYVRNDKYKPYPTKQITLSHKLITNTAAIKRKRVRKKEANTKITPARVIQEETEELGKKPLCYPPISKMIH